MTSAPSHPSDHPLASGRVRELCSGIDALYLSGRAPLPPELVDELEAHRAAAIRADGPLPFRLLDDEWEIEPRSFGKYRYRLQHPDGLIGVTSSRSLPALRVQPRAELLHSIGPTETLRYFQFVAGFLVDGPVEWSLSRLDLFCDVQGWNLGSDDRDRFVCRADRRDLHEEAMAMTGLEFGRRTTKTVCARIYDKTLQVQRKGLDWWPRKWGDRFDPARQVLRIEFELGRQGLVEYGVDTPEQGLAAASELWASVTSDWLSFRTPTGDETRSRWPVAAEWVDVQNASLRGGAVEIDRIRSDRRKGELRLITPALVGYMARAAALSGARSLTETMGALRQIALYDQERRGVMFDDRVAWKVAEDERR